MCIPLARPVQIAQLLVIGNSSILLPVPHSTPGAKFLSRAVTTMRHLRQLPPRSNQEVQCSVQTLFWPQSHALTFYFT